MAMLPPASFATRSASAAPNPMAASRGRTADADQRCGAEVFEGGATAAASSDAAALRRRAWGADAGVSASTSAAALPRRHRRLERRDLRRDAALWGEAEGVRLFQRGFS